MIESKPEINLFVKHIPQIKGIGEITAFSTVCFSTRISHKEKCAQLLIYVTFRIGRLVYQLSPVLEKIVKTTLMKATQPNND